MAQNHLMDAASKQGPELDVLKGYYAGFAEYEAKGRSEPYYRLAKAISSDDESLSLLIEELPPGKRQANLVFACLRRFGVPETAEEFKTLFRQHRDELVPDILSKKTQTNEPARCAGLYLALSTIQKPLSLIEVGASAGLCLLPDRYRYKFNDQEVNPPTAAPDAPLFQSTVTGPAPSPEEDLDVRWRIGVDILPIDVSNEEEVAWLETLVWPGQEARAANLRAAIAEARRDPPKIEKGHLLEKIEGAVEQAPKDTTRVVFHSATMNYLQYPEVQAFEQKMKKMDAVWIAMEDPRLFPHWLRGVDAEIPIGRFLIAIDRQPVAHVRPHGGDIVWLS